MWKSKRRKYMEALLEGIRDRQHELLDKTALQEQRLSEALAQGTNLYSRICSVEENLNYYSMIHRIMTENKYTNLELLSLQLQNTASKKILIAGFFGADNLGDELMLQTLLSYIPEEKLSSVTVLLCDNEGYNYYHLPGVNFIHMPKNRFDLNIMAQYFDTLIWGGGALIDDTDYDKDVFSLNNLFIDLSKRFLAFNKLVYALSVSTNQTLTNEKFVNELKVICDKFRYFSVRDNNSLNLLNSLGINNITLADDLVFYNKLFENAPQKKELSEVPTVGIIWICYEDTKELLKTLLKRISAQFNGKCKIRCIPFYNYVNIDKNYFEEMILEIEEGVDISIADYTNDLENLICEINNMDYMVNFRYHGMLLSALLGKKSLNICYDTHRHYHNKIDYLTRFFEINGDLLYFSKLIDSCNDFEINFVVPTSKHQELLNCKRDFEEFCKKEFA